MVFKQWTTEVLTSSDVNTYLMRQAMIICTSGTRPSSPQVGMRIWQTDTKTEFGWNGSNWGYLSETGGFVRKTSTETVSNSATLQDDDVLFLPVATNVIYILDLFLVYAASTTAGFKITFDFPAGTTLDLYRDSATTAGAAFTNRDAMPLDFNSGVGVSFRTYGVGTSATGHRMSGRVLTGGTSGNVTLRWAQEVSEASNTQLFPQSFFLLKRMSP